MRRFRLLACGLIGLFCCAVAVRAETPSAKRSPAPAAATPSPLRLMPDQADLLIEVKQPRRLVETLTTLGALQQLQTFAPVREFFDSTNYRRAQQFRAYLERELGAPWPQLLDRLAGRGAAGGIVFQSLHQDNARYGVTPTAALLVIEGRDDQLMRKFFQVGLTVLEQELGRQETKDKPVKGSYEGLDTVRVGSQFHAAVAGRTLFLSNTEKLLHAGLDRYLGRAKKSMADVPGVAEAARLLPAEPLASAWLSMENVRKAPQASGLYKMPRDDVNQTILFGGYLDLLGRTPFVCAGVYPEKGGFAATIRTPRGRDGMGPDQILHVPPAGKMGSLPLLEPKDVIYSDSNYFNFPGVWKERAKLFNEKQVQAFEKADNTATPFLAGARLNRLLTQAGTHYRFVAVNQPAVPYKTKPRQSIPAFAVVLEMGEPEAFGKSMEAILRAAALLSTNQFKLKLTEEKYQGCSLVGYRFSETEVRQLKNDVNNLRFNFSPCFTRVKDQFVVCSTIELCRELVDLLQRESTDAGRGNPSPAFRRIYASGAAAYLKTIEDQLVTATILDQAVPPKEAHEQVKVLLDLVRSLGTLTDHATYADKTFQYDIRLQPAK